MTREDVIARYRQLRAACVEAHNAALKNVSRATLLETARRLGLSHGQMLLAENSNDLIPVFDLALYTAKPGRSRAIERYARTRAKAEPEQARIVEALIQARFSVFEVKGRHSVAGLMVEDVLRGDEIWLMDESLEASAQEGMLLAMRIAPAGEFAMTCGIIVPLEPDDFEYVLETTEERVLTADLAAIADDPRFAATVYQLAIDMGLTQAVSYH